MTPNRQPRETWKQYQAGLGAANRIRVIEAARKAFATNGYALSTIDDIARSAGVTLATLYKHFSGKLDLFGAVVEHGVEELALRLDRIDPSEPAAIVLSELARSCGGALRRPANGAVFRIIMAEQAQFPELAEQFQRRAKTPVAAGFAMIISPLIERGELRGGGIPAIAGLFFGLLELFVVWPQLTDPGWVVSDETVELAVNNIGRLVLARYGPDGR